MDDEDEKTPPRPTPKPYRMTDSERDARRHALQHRRAPVPVVWPVAEEITKPIEMILNGELSPEDYAQADAIRRSGLGVELLVMNLAKAFERFRKKEQSGSTEIRDAVVAAISESQRQLAELARRVDSLAGFAGRVAALEVDGAEVREGIGERHTDTKGSIHENLSRLLGTHRTARWLAGLALTAAIGAATYVVTAIRTSGADEVRLNRAERDILNAEQEIRDIRRELRRKEP